VPCPVPYRKLEKAWVDRGPDSNRFLPRPSHLSQRSLERSGPSPEYGLTARVTRGRNGTVPGGMLLSRPHDLQKPPKRSARRPLIAYGCVS